MRVEKLTNSLWKLQVIGWLVYFLLMFLTFLTRDTDETLGYIFLVKTTRTLIGFSLSCILWLIYRNLINRQSLVKIVSISFVASALFGVLWTMLETLFFWLTLDGFDLTSSLQYKPRVALTYTVTLLAWSGIYFVIEYWKQAQTEHRNVLHAKVLAETAQLEMLRYQVNPHFLFNALNSIRASVAPDNPAAKQMITQLSEFLRHSLMSNEKKENTLCEELEAVENYLAIEKIRFEESLEYEFDVDEEAKMSVLPSFLLNPLIENAVKHGFSAGNEILKIKISAKLDKDKLSIEVANTGQLGQPTTVKLPQIGLTNVQERLNKRLSNSSSFKLFERNGWVIAKVEIFQNDN